MNLFLENDYKSIIKLKVQALKQEDKKMSLRWIAENVPVQYTYLSRALNNQEIDLSETHVFRIGGLLRLSADEKEYLLLVRSAQVTQDKELKEFHLRKIQKISEAHKVNTEVKAFEVNNLQKEISYLLDPYAVIIHAALGLPSVLKKPNIICSSLGLTENQLSEKLLVLENMGFIQYSKTKKSIESVHKNKMHFNPDHPMMRSHQQILRNLCNAHVLKLTETSKSNFMATFSGDAQLFSRVKEEFKLFISKIQKLSEETADERIYQLNFDLFPWI